jgi:hypothetical protein
MSRPKRTSRPKWTEEEVLLLKNNIATPKRSVNGLRSKRTRMGIRSTRPPRPRWTEDQAETLKKLVSDGHSARSIHGLGVLPHGVNAIQKMMCRSGLAKKMKVFKFPHEIRERFRAFLLKNWEAKTPEDLQELWNRENARFPANKSKVVDYLTKMKLKISYGEVQRIKALRRKEQKIKKDANPSERNSSRLAEKIRMERARIMRRRIEQNKNIWTGMSESESECEIEA